MAAVGPQMGGRGGAGARVRCAWEEMGAGVREGGGGRQSERLAHGEAARGGRCSAAAAARRWRHMRVAGPWALGPSPERSCASGAIADASFARCVSPPSPPPRPPPCHNLCALQVKVSGNKEEQKLYRRHSGRPGGMKVEKYRHLQERIPERIVEKAIKGMLPKGRLGRTLFTNLKVYKGAEHPHEAQNPTTVDLKHCVYEK